METLIDLYKALLYRIDTSFVRYLHDQINWKSRLIAILGARGVGKTTLLLQHIKLFDDPSQSLYVLADDFYFSEHRLFDLAKDFYQQGGKKLYIDEIHKYKNWSVEIKNIYDTLPDLQVVYTGSSILELEQGGADLSRRKIEYLMTGLSLREYINISHNLNLCPYSLSEILNGEVDFPMNELRPLQQMANYLQAGYYPFFKEDDYAMRLNGILKQTVEFDIPQFADFNYASIQKLKKLSLFTIVILGMIFSLSGIMFPESVCKIFLTITPEMSDIAKRGIRLYFVAFLPMGINLLTSYLLQAVMKVKKALLISLLRNILLSSVCILLFPILFGGDSLWMVMPVVEIQIMVISIFFLGDLLSTES